MTTRFTIAIPTHNRRDTVLLATRSALAQTRAPEQVLVLCDGCSDGTADALRELDAEALTTIELPKGAGYGYEHRNRSLERATGEAIVWLSDDDLLMPDHLERIGELWDTGRYDLVQSRGVVVHPDDRLEAFGSDWSVPVSRAQLANANTNAMSSVSVRVQLARSIGGWDATRERAADWDLWQRLLAGGARSACSPEPTVLHFRARGREQPWPDRVRQTAAWFDRLQDPRQTLDVRIRARRARAEREANVEQNARAVDEHAAELTERAVFLHHELAARDAQAAMLGERIRALTAELDGNQRELINAREQAARSEETLRRIYAGGWWRLRNRLRTVVRIGRRGR